MKNPPGYDPFDLAGNFSPVTADPREAEPFLDWYRGLRSKTGFAQVQAGLNKIWAKHPDEGQRATLVLQIFRACWEAHLFRQGGDPMATARQLSGDADATREAIAPMAEALAKRLAAIPADHPLALNLGFAAGLARDRGVALSAPEMTNTGRWHTLLTALAEAMRDVTPGHKCGPFPQRTHVGCLDYPSSIESRPHRPDAPTLLLFDLVFFFRDYTATGNAFRRTGPMPTHGSPHYQAAADIVNLVFDTDWGAESARGLLRQLLKSPAPNRGAWVRSRLT